MEEEPQSARSGHSKEIAALQKSAASSARFIPPPMPPLPENNLHQLVNDATSKDVWTLLLIFRFINAIAVATFFQPDEYFQALEPAWRLAFGPGSGAWITWEWENQLRSSLHPMLFALIYFIFDKPMEFLQFYPQFRAFILSALPRIVQGVIAAVGDFYTWKYAERLYGLGSQSAWVSLLLSILSPWQWFCSTRTLSNSLETTLTIIALRFWPWELGTGSLQSSTEMESTDKTVVPYGFVRNSLNTVGFRASEDLKKLRISLVFASFACVLRPTNLLIWISLALFTAFQFASPYGSSKRNSPGHGDIAILILETILCGSAVLSVSAISDRLYYGIWTFPPYQLLNFNIVQSLAIFYGTNNWHYYLTQGLPLLTTTYLPFTLYGIYVSTTLAPATSIPPKISSIRFQLAFIIIAMIAMLSLISHKEVRFIYPLLPALHVLTAPHIAAFFATEDMAGSKTKIQETSSKIEMSKSATRDHTYRSPTYLDIILRPDIALNPRGFLTTIMVLANIAIAIYTTQFHQRGVLSVVSHLRSEYERIHMTNEGVLRDTLNSTSPQIVLSHRAIEDSNEIFAGFLMPCHSTPWRSQLVYPTLNAWALGCEPPLNIPAGSPERQAYRDEADRFYDNPMEFLRKEINTQDKPWPRYVVGFQGIESVLREYYQDAMPGWIMKENWRGFNSHFHDDSRRTGDVIVWEFLDGSNIDDA